MVARIFAVFLGLLLTVSSSAWSDQATLQFQRIRGDYFSLMKSTQDKLYRDNWLRIIDEFRRFANRYPTHDKGPAALYMAGRACEELHKISRADKDALQAARIYDEVDIRFPKSSLADDALILAARIYDTILKDAQEAVSRYARVIRAYPEGDQAERAQRALSRLSPYALQTVQEVLPNVSPSENEVLYRLERIRSEAHSEYSRIVLDLTGPAAFSYATLPGDRKKNIAPRLYVDLRNTSPAADIPSKRDVQDPILKRIRTGRPDDQKTRVVLDLHAFQAYRVFFLENPFRIVIDVAARKNAWDASSVSWRFSPQADHISKVLDKLPVEKEPAINLRPAGELKVIVVDPGHGGKDPGAIGPNGVQEKDVVLAIAKILAKRLKEEFRCRVVLTRDRDTFLSLEERTKLANRLNADLFISIHANASPNRDARGIETYYLNFSKNEAAATVAARENGITLQEVSDLELILFDLMANSKINESSLLADKVQKGVVQELARKYARIRDHGVRQGPFHVLLGATMPSILVETAYISNPKEESRLISRNYQEQVARGIVSGVRDFANILDMVAKK